MYRGDAEVFLEGLIEQCKTSTVDWDKARTKGRIALRELESRVFVRRPDKTRALGEEPSYNVLNAVPFFRAVLNCLKGRDAAGAHDSAVKALEALDGPNVPRDVIAIPAASKAE